MNADSNLNNPTEGTEVAPDVQQLIEAAKKEGWRECAMAELDHQKQVDNDARNEPNLRKAMCILISELSSLLDDHAHQLAMDTKGDAGAYATDNAKDLLTWQLAEFLTRSYLERDPDEPPITRGWQVDCPHARDFFAVDLVASTGQLEVREVEESRK